MVGPFGFVHVIVAATALWMYFKRAMVYVPNNHVAAVVRRGGARRIIRTGWNVVFWPQEHIHSVSWSCAEEGPNGNIRRRQHGGFFIPVTPQQLDVVPVKAYTKDGVEVHVNGTLHFRINDVNLVLDGVPDLFLQLEDCVQAGCKAAVCQQMHNDLFGRDLEVSSEIMSHVNQQLLDSGVVCTAFKVQDIAMNKQLTAAYEKAIVSARAQDTKLTLEKQALKAEMERFELETKRAERKRKRDVEEAEADAETQKRLAKIEQGRVLSDLEYSREKMERELQVTQAELNLVRAREEISMTKDILKNQQDVDTKRALMEAGFTSEQMTRLSLASKMAKALSCTEKLIVTDGQRLPLGLLTNFGGETTLHVHEN